MNFDYVKHTIYLTVSGSRAYGTFNEDSDTDYKGIIIAPQEISDGFITNFEQKEGLEGYGTDSVAYEIRKFFRLAADCNPNIIETLFVPDDLIVIDSDAAKLLREHRYEFLSQRARYSFGGYAHQQFKRIKNHKAWWDKENAGEIPAKPLRKELGLPEKPKYPKDQLNSLITMPSDLLIESEREYFVKERQYFHQKQLYDKWKKWRDNRNPERAALEVKSGFDGKHASHLVRLLSMAEEILRDGEVVVRRPDADFLRDIRNGNWSYEKLTEWVEEQENKLVVLGEKTTLPNYPDINKLNDLCVELVRRARER